MKVFYNIIYQPSINKFLRNINRLLAPVLPEKIKIPPTGKIRLNLSKTSCSFYLKTNQTSFLTKQLFFESPENFEYSNIFIELIQKVNVFLDVGANIGYYSILGGKLNKNLKIIAFEPAVGPMIYLNENAKINRLEKNIKVETLALSDINDEIDFYVLKNQKFPTIYNLSGEHNIGTKKDKISSKIRVQSMTLDTYVKQNDITSIDLIKLDTEGAESSILRGASSTIKKMQPIIICELLFNKIENELDQIMLKHNYLYFLHTDRGLEQVDSLTRTIDDGVRNCFFVPPHKISFIKEWIVQQ